jgi:hypothetical protein
VIVALLVRPIFVALLVVGAFVLGTGHGAYVTAESMLSSVVQLQADHGHRLALARSECVVRLRDVLAPAGVVGH